MSEIQIMLPMELPPTRTSKYPSPNRSLGLGTLGLRKVGLLGDRSGDDTPIEDKQMCFASEGEDQDEGWNDVEDLTRNLTSRKRHRRGKAKKRKWKPYYKLSWQERRELEEREAQRANNARESRFAHGQPVAPYNTTQFLMDDHNVQELDLSHQPNGHKIREGATTRPIGSTEDFYSSPEDEEEFLQKQFSEAYENVHAERLNAMSKAELVKEYMELEVRVDGLEDKLKQQLRLTRTASGALPVPDTSPGTVTDQPLTPDEIAVTLTMDPVTLLRAENEKLKLENELLRTMLFPSASP